MQEKIKSFTASEEGKLMYIVIVILCVAIGSYSLGRLSMKNTENPVLVRFEGKQIPLANELEPISDSESTTQVHSVANTSANALVGKDVGIHPYVASKRGKKYYPISCSAASTLKQENKIYFDTEEEAQAKGYSLSQSCMNN